MAVQAHTDPEPKATDYTFTHRGNRGVTLVMEVKPHPISLFQRIINPITGFPFPVIRFTQIITDLMNRPVPLIIIIYTILWQL